VPAAVTLTTPLACSPDAAWARVCTPALLHYVSAPLVRFSSDADTSLPEVWEPGEYRLWMHLQGRESPSWQAVVISFPEPAGDTRFLRDNGYGPDIERWDHWIEVAPAAGGGTRYTDRVTIDAGPRTPAVAAFAEQLYAHRQGRLRELAASGFAALGA